MSDIAILLSTYNSSLYLRELLNSIISQTHKEWDMYIRDDMSTDDTIDIINEYTQKDNRIHFFYDKEKRGPLHSFMWLFEHVDTEFYMFCDHDDVWLPNKIEMTYKKMLAQKDVEHTPIIVCTDVKLVDKSLNVIAESYWHYKNYKESLFNNKYYHLFYNNILGCCMMTNKISRNVAFPYPDNTIMHDYWIVIATLWNKGRVVWVNHPLMLYRQHGDNTIGGGKERSILQQMLILPHLLKKGYSQFLSNKDITKIHPVTFFVLKIYYYVYSKISYTFKK